VQRDDLKVLANLKGPRGQGVHGASGYGMLVGQRRQNEIEDFRAY
jgi:hypothetical protein